ncbi:hypothetical protein CB1_001616052 [Camelus ferus]|nr:hypothetical protein CB1_001616052 [Camelus ferus]
MEKVPGHGALFYLLMPTDFERYSTLGGLEVNLHGDERLSYTDSSEPLDPKWGPLLSDALNAEVAVQVTLGDVRGAWKCRRRVLVPTVTTCAPRTRQERRGLRCFPVNKFWAEEMLSAVKAARQQPAEAGLIWDRTMGTSPERQPQLLSEGSAPGLRASGTILCSPLFGFFGFSLLHFFPCAFKTTCFPPPAVKM